MKLHTVHPYYIREYGVSVRTILVDVDSDQSSLRMGGQGRRREEA